MMRCEPLRCAGGKGTTPWMPLNDPRRTIVVRFPPHLARWVPVLPFLILALWLVFTSWYTVPAKSVGIVLRFGKFDAIREPGLHFKLPFGIDEILAVAVKRQLKMELGFGTPGATIPASTPTRRIARKPWSPGISTRRSSNGWCSIRLDDPKRYLFSVRNPEDTLRDLSESIMREIIGDRTVDEVITIRRQDIENSSHARLRGGRRRNSSSASWWTRCSSRTSTRRARCRRLSTKSTRRNRIRENMMNIANGEYNKVVPRASGAAEQKRRVTKGYKLKRVNEALGDVSAFSAVLAEYLKAPEVTRTADLPRDDGRGASAGRASA